MNEMKGLEQRVRAAVEKIAQRPIPDQVDSLQDYPLDSLAKLELLAVLEKEFAITLAETDVAQFESISRITRLVHRARDAQHGQD